MIFGGIATDTSRCAYCRDSCKPQAVIMFLPVVMTLNKRCMQFISSTRMAVAWQIDMFRWRTDYRSKRKKTEACGTLTSHHTPDLFQMYLIRQLWKPISLRWLGRPQVYVDKTKSPYTLNIEISTYVVWWTFGSTVGQTVKGSRTTRPVVRLTRLFVSFYKHEEADSRVDRT